MKSSGSTHGGKVSGSGGVGQQKNRKSELREPAGRGKNEEKKRVVKSNGSTHDEQVIGGKGGQEKEGKVFCEIQRLHPRRGGKRK